MKKIPKQTLPQRVLKFQLQHFKTLLFLVVTFFMAMCSGMSVFDPNSVKAGDLDAIAKTVCGGKISDCLAGSVGEEMDSQSSKRMLLMQRSYISYDTLKRDFVPCGRPGASYYNCGGTGPANNYNRGCEIITRCARGD